MLKCREATRLLSERLERDLSLGERLNIRVHTLMCSGCRNFGHQMETLRVISHTYAAGSYEADPLERPQPETGHGESQVPDPITDDTPKKTDEETR